MNPYLKNQIETASQEQILIMLYDGAINFLNKAKKAIKENNIEQSCQNLIKAQNIISELQNSLVITDENIVSKDLYKLYAYFNKRLVFANIKRKIEPIDEVLEHLKGLKETWKKAIIIAKDQEDIKEEEY